MIVSHKMLLHVLSHMKHSQAGNKLHLKAKYFSARRDEQQAAWEFKVRIQQETSSGSVQCTWKPHIPSLFMNTSNLLCSPHLQAKNNSFAMQSWHQELTSLFGITFRCFLFFFPGKLMVPLLCMWTVTLFNHWDHKIQNSFPHGTYQSLSSK